MTPVPTPSEPGTVVLPIEGPISRDDEPALCERLHLALARDPGGRVVCDVEELVRPGVAAVGALARLQLAARRAGHQVSLRGASAELVELLELTGLDLVLPRVRSASMGLVTTVAVDTPHGRAVAHLHPADDPWAALVLGHGAGGGVAARDLTATTAVARSEGVSVALVEQPYRVAGRRSTPPAHRLDAAWTAVVDHLLAYELRGLPLIVGGRSAGARVACRTSAVTGAIGVLCLAFPLQPSRAGAPSRLPELDAVAVPTLVVQGARDPFGVPPAAPGRTVVRVHGDHSLRTDLDSVTAAVRAWLATVAKLID